MLKLTKKLSMKERTKKAQLLLDSVEFALAEYIIHPEQIEVWKDFYYSFLSIADTEISFQQNTLSKFNEIWK